MRLIFVIIFVFLFPSVYSLSMVDLLPSCNYNTYCEDSENWETCPDDCPRDDVVLSEEDRRENRYSAPAVKYGYIIRKEETPFPLFPFLSLLFVLVFCLLVIFLYRWIHLHKEDLQKKEHKKKNLFSSKPERRLGI